MFEGGQLPLVKRLPFMRGFTNLFRTEYCPVNVQSLDAFDDGAEVTPDLLVEKRLVRRRTGQGQDPWRGRFVSQP